MCSGSARGSGSGRFRAVPRSGSGRFRCGSGVVSGSGSRWFRCGAPIRFQKVQVQAPGNQRPEGILPQARGANEPQKRNRYMIWAAQNARPATPKNCATEGRTGDSVAGPRRHSLVTAERQKRKIYGPRHRPKTANLELQNTGPANCNTMQLKAGQGILTEIRGVTAACQGKNKLLTWPQPAKHYIGHAKMCDLATAKAGVSGFFISGTSLIGISISVPFGVIKHG